MALLARFCSVSSAKMVAPRLQLHSLLTARCVRTGAQMSEQDPEIITDLKEKQLKGESEVQIPGTEGWSHNLASSAEAIVKAEKMADMPMEILQNHSVNVIQQVHSDDPNPKVGSDVSQQPAMKENLDKTKA